MKKINFQESIAILIIMLVILGGRRDRLRPFIPSSRFNRHWFTNGLAGLP